jgi:ribonuclease D
VAAADLDPKDERALLALPGFGGRSVRRLARVWLDALDEARALPDDQLPVNQPVEGPPPPHRWAERDPVAASRLARCREVVSRLATEHRMPPENLLSPDAIRRLAWEPPVPLEPESVRAALAGYGARQWQLGLTVGPLTTALSPPVAIVPEPDPGEA